MSIRDPVRRLVPVLLMIVALAGCRERGEAVGSVEKLPDLQRADQPKSHGALEEARERFTCGGKPIHPGLVHEFMPWMSDGLPTTVAVDLLPSVDSNEFNEDDVKIRAAWIECDLREELSAVGVRPSFGYQRSGILADGTQVLRTYYCGGGSGTFMCLMLIRFDTEKAFDLGMKPYTRLLMKLVCLYALGDDDDAKVQVLKDRVIVGRSKCRDKEVVLKLE